MELLYWLQDVRQHRVVNRRREALREPGQGVDYSAEIYGRQVPDVVQRLHPSRMELRVVQVREETPSTKTLRLERTDGDLPPFRPGQYVNLFVEIDGVRSSRPYSIASPPGTGYIELTVRRVGGGFVAPYLLSKVEEGQELASTGPAGSFYHEPLIDGDELVFIAGGSGITPFASIIRDAVARERALDVHLLYGSRSPEDVIFGTEFARLADEHRRLHYSLVISHPPHDYDGLTGFIGADLITERVGDVSGKTFYLCGPGAMIDHVLPALDELGVPRHKIRREVYGPPEHITGEPGWPDGVTRSKEFRITTNRGEPFTARAGEPLMNALEREGIELPSVCRSGECSYCRTRLVSGQVFMPQHVGVRQCDRDHGYIHPCLAYPVSDVELELPHSART